MAMNRRGFFGFVAKAVVAGAVVQYLPPLPVGTAATATAAVVPEVWAHQYLLEELCWMHCCRRGERYVAFATDESWKELAKLPDEVGLLYGGHIYPNMQERYLAEMEAAFDRDAVAA